MPARSWKRLAAAASVLPIGGLTVGAGAEADAAVTPTVPGHPDVTFGTAGTAVLDLADRLAAEYVDATPSIDGTTLVAAAHVGGVTLSRYLADGRLDPDFAEAGTLWLDPLPAPEPTGVPHVVARPGGGAFVLARLCHGGACATTVVAVNPDGTVDTGFSTDGRAPVATGVGWPADVALTPDGGLLFAGPSVSYYGGFASITRMNPDGTVDIDFGTNGLVGWYREDGSAGFAISDIDVAADGTITALGRVIDPTGSGTARLARYDAGGAPLADVVTLFEGTVLATGGLLPDGDGFVLGITRGTSTLPNVHAPGKATVVRVDAAGVVDETFGGPDGVDVIPVADGTVADLTRAADGTITVAVPVTVDDRPLLAAVVRLDEEGEALGAPWVPRLGGGVAVAELVGDDLLVNVGQLDRIDRAYLVDSSSDASNPETIELGIPIDVWERPGGALVRSDGSSIVVGTADGDALVVSRHADGSLDTDFGTDGVARWRNGVADDLRLTDVVELADGRLVVVGTEDGRGVHVAQLTADGELVDAFGETGHAVTAPAGDSAGPAVAVDALGRILVTTAGGVTRFLPNGVPDDAFGEGGTVTVLEGNTVRGVAVIGNDPVLLAHRDRGVVSDGVVVRLTDTGAIDAGFGTDGFAVPVPRDQGSAVNGIVVTDDDRIYVGGSRVVRLLADGTLDPTFDTGDGPGAGAVVGVTDRFVYDATSRSDGGIDIGRYDLSGRRDDRYTDYARPRSAHGLDGVGVAVDAADRVLLAGGRFDGGYRFRLETSRFVGGVLPPPPAVSIGDAGVVEGTRVTGDASLLTFPVTLSAPSDVPVTATVTIGPGSTAGTEDGLPVQDARRTVVFAPGQTLASFTVPVIPDAVDEADETIVYQILSLEYGLPGRALATGTIYDDDGPAVSPGTPAAVVATAGRGHVTASWAPPATPGPAPVLRYTVLVVQGGAITGWVFVPGDARSASVDKLVDGRTADVYVAAWTANGIGPWSPVVRTIPTALGLPILPAAAPTVTTAVHEPRNRVRLVLGAPPADGGSPIVAYSVSATDRTTGQVAAWRNVGADVRAITLSGLSTSRRYDVRVSAVTSLGFGQVATIRPTVSTTVTTPTLGPPAWAVATAGRRSVTATWGPAAEHGRVVGGYAVVVWQGGQIRSWLTVGADARTATATGLVAGQPADVVIVPFDTTGAYGGVLPSHPRATPTA